MHAPSPDRWTTRRDQALRALGPPLLLALAITLLFSRSLRNGYTQDDTYLITRNADVHRFAGGEVGWRIFFEHSLFHGVGEEEDFTYRPLTLLTVGLDARRALRSLPPRERELRLSSYRTNGVLRLPSRPFHRTNLALYGLLVALLAILLRRLLRRHFRPDFTAYGAAILFATLPAHLPVLCNIKHREEALALLCWAAAWLAWEGFVARRRRGGAGWLLAAAAWVGSFFALLSKESGVTLGLVLFLWYEVFRAGRERSEESLDRRGSARLLLPYLGFVLAGVAWLVLKTHAVGTGGTRPGEIFFVPGEHVGVRLLTFAGVFLRYYLVEGLLLHRIHPDFSSRYVIAVENGSPSLLALAGLAIIGLALALALFLYRRRARLSSFWIVFFFVAFAVGSGVPVAHGSGGAFRLLFTPSLSYAVLLALALAALAGRLPPRIARLRPATAALVLLIVYQALRALPQVPVWDSDATLYARALELDPRNPSPYLFLGGVELQSAAENGPMGSLGDGETYRRGRAEALLTRAVDLWESRPENLIGKETPLYAQAKLALVTVLDASSAEPARTAPALARHLREADEALARNEEIAGADHSELRYRALLWLARAEAFMGHRARARAAIERARGIPHPADPIRLFVVEARVAKSLGEEERAEEVWNELARVLDARLHEVRAGGDERLARDLARSFASRSDLPPWLRDRYRGPPEGPETGSSPPQGPPGGGIPAPLPPPGAPR
jgi:hypothetical protein